IENTNKVHPKRMKDSAQARREWEAGNIFKKKRGRPKNTWDGEIGKLLKNRGITWKEAERMAANRKEWKKLIQ
ncbi:hypothetical protein HHI36_017348, partial [Cryptolaemus montrouzieri]